MTDTRNDNVGCDKTVKIRRKNKKLRIWGKKMLVKAKRTFCDKKQGFFLH